MFKSWIITQRLLHQFIVWISRACHFPFSTQKKKNITKKCPIMNRTGLLKLNSTTRKFLCRDCNCLWDYMVPLQALREWMNLERVIYFFFKNSTIYSSLRLVYHSDNFRNKKLFVYTCKRHVDLLITHLNFECRICFSN